RLAKTENQGLKINPSGQAEARLRVQQFIYLGVAVNIVLALSLASFYMQTVVKRLGTLTDNTTRLGRGAALNPPLSGGDEIANLDRVFHEMAAALMEAAAKERAMTESARASEARVQSIIDGMPVGLVITSTEGIIEAANPRMLQIFGSTADELSGKNLVEFFRSAEIGTFSVLADKHKERAVGGTAEWQAKRLDGATFPAELQLNDFATQDGQRILAIIEDVSARHEV